jgi:hypothetical protein
MRQRSGEKLGWIGGWLGGFIWVGILATILLVRGQLLEGMIGCVIVAVAVAVILVGAPWKHPDTLYGKLMLPVYVLFFASVGWAVWAAEDVYYYELSPWHAFMLIPILSPFWTAGRRCWNDSGSGENGEEI